MDWNKTLEQLENDYWKAPTYHSYLTTTCYNLRKKPLRNFVIEDLRILIGQNISLKYLIPLALSELEKDILAEGNFYRGDLLISVLKSDPNYWIANTNDRTKLCGLVDEKIELITKSDNTDDIKNDILESIKKFKNNNNVR